MDHILWTCPAYSRCHTFFFSIKKKTLQKEFESFKSCNTVGKSCFILGEELWESHYEELLGLVKSYIIDIWEMHKSKLYNSGTGPLQYQS